MEINYVRKDVEMRLESKIKRMNELYPKWESIVNTMFLDASIHGMKASSEDDKILKEFAKLMEDVGIKPITSGRNED